MSYLKVCLPILALGLLLTTGCNTDYVPKPKGYPRLYLPSAGYKALGMGLPYEFEVSMASTATPSKDRLSEPLWIDIHYPGFDATVQITYKKVTGMKDLNEYIEDARKLTSKHQIRATAIEESMRKVASGDIAYTFRLEGQVPTQYQFFVTDSSKHFLRGALYFKTATQNDSLAPIIDYVARDMEHLLNTLRWTR